MSRIVRALEATLPVVIAALILFGVGALDGRPAVFSDTDEYYSQGEYFAARLHLPFPSPTSERLRDPTSVMPDARIADRDVPLASAGGRSAFYGLFLYASHAIGGLWLLSFLQALAAALAVRWVTLVLWQRESGGAYLGLMMVLALATSLPFYTAFAMPDVFGGLGILAATLLLLHIDRLARWSGAGAWVLLVATLTVHTANTATIAGLAILGAGLLAWLGQNGKTIVRRILLVASAVVMATLATATFAVAYRLDTGHAQATPPFLMARVLADGPGRVYLRAACPGGASPTLCRFKDRPLDDVGDFLWSDDPAVAVYSVVDHATQTQLKQDEPAFVRATLAFDPLGQFRASMTNWLTQLSMSDVVEPFRNPTTFSRSRFWSRETLHALVPSLGQCDADAAGCEPRLAGRWLTILHTAVLELSVVMLMWDLVTTRRRVAAFDPRTAARLRLAGATALLVGLGIVVNAGVCGMIAGPFVRYQGRLIWLLPMLAVVVRVALARASHRVTTTRKSAGGQRPSPLA